MVKYKVTLSEEERQELQTLQNMEVGSIWLKLN